MAAGLLDHVLTAENLSATFAMPLLLSRDDGGGRPAARCGIARLSGRPTSGAGTAPRGSGTCGLGGCMDWLRDHTWEAWLGVSILLGVAEIIGFDLILLMLALGALVGMLAALVGLPVVAQVLAAAAASVAALALVRPSIVRRLHGGPDLMVGHGKLVGQQGLVTADHQLMAPGRIKLSGEVWSAVPYDERLTIEPGSTVEVLEIRGATAYVHPVAALEP